ncbi:MAG TPA: hypothetical protein VG963_08490, partial [Polyangiaceae bacterium]|nr:hypothetical protein [Polyangiaceae bacterium]
MNRKRERAAWVCGIALSAVLLQLGCGGQAIDGAETGTDSCGAPGTPCTGMAAASGAPKAPVPSAPDSDFVRDTSSCEDNPLLAGCPVQPL